MAETQFDAIVIGSGITGGWAAKELCEQGFRTLVLERGPNVEHGKYPTESAGPWNMPFRGRGDSLRYMQEYGSAARYISGLTEYADHFYVKDSEEPYQVENGTEFHWVRGYQLGGKSLIWGRHVPRFAPLDFEANAADGHGGAWPIRYADLEKWYSHVESFIGVSGQKEGLPHYPDGEYLPPFELTEIVKHLNHSLESTHPDRRLTVGRTANLTRAHNGRAPCMSRLHCQRGCSLGAYFNSLSSTLPAARATGNLTVLTDTIAESLDFDALQGRICGVRAVNARTKARARYSARVFFVCGSSFNSTHLLLNSRSAAHPNGLGGGSGVLGRYILDHVMGAFVEAVSDRFPEVYSYANRPTPFIVPRFKNLSAEDLPFRRGYFYFGSSGRLGWSRGTFTRGIGASLKDRLRRPGPWLVSMNTCGEMLPRSENRLSLDERLQDRYGIPQLRIAFRFSQNEESMMVDAQREAVEMFKAAGLRVLSSGSKLEPGGRLHEMGGARMGANPAESVLNAYNQCHEAGNVFVTDGASMPSGSCYNPSLTYMALTARAAEYAGTLLKQRKL
jgi:choline dehydrogenase-like flavoprotein